IVESFRRRTHPLLGSASPVELSLCSALHRCPRRWVSGLASSPPSRCCPRRWLNHDFSVAENSISLVGRGFSVPPSRPGSGGCSAVTLLATTKCYNFVNLSSTREPFLITIESMYLALKYSVLASILSMSFCSRMFKLFLF
ncbi:hypothetical protein SOVF_015160, partial [Spinacia oleracea]